MKYISGKIWIGNVDISIGWWAYLLYISLPTPLKIVIMPPPQFKFWISLYAMSQCWYTVWYWWYVEGHLFDNLTPSSCKCHGRADAKCISKLVSRIYLHTITSNAYKSWIIVDWLWFRVSREWISEFYRICRSGLKFLSFLMQKLLLSYIYQ